MSRIRRQPETPEVARTQPLDADQRKLFVPGDGFTIRPALQCRKRT